MIQVASFALPGEQDKANEFLATHKPEGTINFNKDTIVVFYDNGKVSVEHQVADINELIESAKKVRFQQEVALFMLKRDIADKKPGSNQWQEFNSAIMQTEAKIDDQDAKISFCKERIAELEGSLSK